LSQLALRRETLRKGRTNQTFLFIHLPRDPRGERLKKHPLRFFVLNMGGQEEVKKGKEKKRTKASLVSKKPDVQKDVEKGKGGFDPSSFIPFKQLEKKGNPCPEKLPGNPFSPAEMFQREEPYTRRREISAIPFFLRQVPSDTVGNGSSSSCPFLPCPWSPPASHLYRGG